MIIIKNMAKKVEKIYIGVAWPYVNDIFHLGNLAGAFLPPDIFSRFHKLKGNLVLMVSGSDFHGTPITIRAEKEGKKPEEIAKRFHQLEKKYLHAFEIEYSLYTSTHTKNHQKVVQEMFLKLLKNGYIKILKTKQPYSETAKKFLQDRYIEGECPFCHSKGARGDQCEKCGRSLNADQLINPLSKIDQSPILFKETENYFLDLSKFKKEIEDWLNSRVNWREWVKKEALGWVKEGLNPRAITRDMEYGVPLPIAKIPCSQKIENIKNKVFYVWFEAVIGYLSAAIEYSKKIKKPDYWRDFFYDKKAKTYYFVGQDNLVFHTINWPAQLLGYDKKINLPTNVFVNKFLLLEGQKMSKSRNWIIDTPYLAETYPVEAIRFYLSANMPEEKELDFRWEDFIKTNNNTLVGVIGNFIHRVLSILLKNNKRKFEISLNDVSDEIKKNTEKTFSETEISLQNGNFRNAIKKILELVIFANQYVEKNKIWTLFQQGEKKAENIFKNCLFLIYELRILLSPFLPKASEQLNKFLNCPKIKTELGKNYWQIRKEKIKINITKKIFPLFLKIDEKNIAIEKEKLFKKQSL